MPHIFDPVEKISKLNTPKERTEVFKAIIVSLEPQYRIPFIQALLINDLLDPNWLLIRYRINGIQNCILYTMLQDSMNPMLKSIFDKFTEEQLKPLYCFTFSFFASKFSRVTDNQTLQKFAKILVNLAVKLSPEEIRQLGGDHLLAKAVHGNCVKLVDQIANCLPCIEAQANCVSLCVKHENSSGLELLLSKSIVNVNQAFGEATLLELVIKQLSKSPSPNLSTIGIPLLDVLFEFHVDVNAKNSTGKDVLMFLHPYRSDILRALIENGFVIKAEHIDKRNLTLIIYNFDSFKPVLDADRRASGVLQELLRGQPSYYLEAHPQANDILRHLARSPSPSLGRRSPSLI